MKTLLPLFFILFLTFSFGQKKEVKKATKLFESGDVQAAISMLESNASLFDAADAKVLLPKMSFLVDTDRGTSIKSSNLFIFF